MQVERISADITLKHKPSTGKPVSYTHLDVYKRQIVYMCISSVFVPFLCCIYKNPFVLFLKSVKITILT